MPAAPVLLCLYPPLLGGPTDVPGFELQPLDWCPDTLPAALQQPAPPAQARVLLLGSVDPAMLERQLRQLPQRPAALAVLVEADLDPATEARCLQLGMLLSCPAGAAAARQQMLQHARQLLQPPHGLLALLHALQQEREQLQSSLDNLPAPLFFKDADGVYRGCNRAFEAYLGLPRAGIVGKTVFDVAPPELAQVYAEADQRLLASGGGQIYDARVRYADGQWRDVTFHKAVTHDAAGRVTGQAGAIFDITERKRLEQSLRELAERDSLTGLLNRRTFFEQAEPRLAAAAADTEQAVILLDVDHFKAINDRHGHAAGDQALRHLSTLLQGALAPDALCVRLGGEEFGILLAQAEGAHALAEQLRSRVATSPCLVPMLGETPAQLLQFTISLGVATFEPQQTSLDQALSWADHALYRAKQGGRNSVQSAAVQRRVRPQERA